jgi:hypothetical protein
VFIDHLSKRLENQGMQEETQNAFEMKKVLLRLSQADSAREQNNFPLALKLLKTTHRASVFVSPQSVFFAGGGGLPP